MEISAKEIKIEEYNYELPEEKIAFTPLAERDESKLLIYTNETITEDKYKNIASYIPSDAVLIFNNTKVIQARLFFKKETGATIEIFVLEPHLLDIATAMQQNQSIDVKCYIGGANKWKKDNTLSLEVEIKDEKLTLYAFFIAQESDNYIVKLIWNTEHSFVTILEHAGNLPLPPYIKRKAEASDKNRYQTIYAAHNGSVAAPTAGLHFTPNIFESLAAQQIVPQYVTLHVGAGTFKPVSSEKMENHFMHAEVFTVAKNLIENLLQNKKIIAVGTTTTRTLESLYWIGIKIFQNKNILPTEINISQWDAYELTPIAVDLALTALLNWMQKNNILEISAATQLLITPGYSFKICNALVTNFHQPKSTLLLLVAAATNGKWKSLYDYALANDFRFLSYGDGSLIFINE